MNYRTTKDQYEGVIYLLKNTTSNLSHIAKKSGLTEGRITYIQERAIENGDLDPEYRRLKLGAVQWQYNDVVRLLTETTWTNDSIGKKVGVSRSTVRSIQDYAIDNSELEAKYKRLRGGTVRWQYDKTIELLGTTVLRLIEIGRIVGLGVGSIRNIQNRAISNGELDQQYRRLNGNMIQLQHDIIIDFLNTTDYSSYRIAKEAGISASTVTDIQDRAIKDELLDSTKKRPLKQKKTIRLDQDNKGIKCILEKLKIYGSLKKNCEEQESFPISTYSYTNSCNITDISDDTLSEVLNKIRSTSEPIKINMPHQYPFLTRVNAAEEYLFDKIKTNKYISLTNWLKDDKVLEEVAKRRKLCYKEIVDIRDSKLQFNKKSLQTKTDVVESYIFNDESARGIAEVYTISHSSIRRWVNDNNILSEVAKRLGLSLEQVIAKRDEKLNKNRSKRDVSAFQKYLEHPESQPIKEQLDIYTEISPLLPVAEQEKALQATAQWVYDHLNGQKANFPPEKLHYVIQKMNLGVVQKPNSTPLPELVSRAYSSGIIGRESVSSIFSRIVVDWVESKHISRTPSEGLKALDELEKELMGV